MEILKAIETKYKGYTFRSRLEARWAVFFDSLGIEWEYEAEGYNLEGIWYLPDFWLPKFNGGMYVEVKPQQLNEIEEIKATRLSLLSKRPVWLAIGVPEAKQYLVYSYIDYFDDFMFCYGIPLIMEAESSHMMYYNNGDFVDKGGYLVYAEFSLLGGYTSKPTREIARRVFPRLFAASDAAKSARF